MAWPDVRAKKSGSICPHYSLCKKSGTEAKAIMSAMAKGTPDPRNEGDHSAFPSACFPPASFPCLSFRNLHVRSRTNIALFPRHQGVDLDRSIKLAAPGRPAGHVVGFIIVLLLVRSGTPICRMGTCTLWDAADLQYTSPAGAVQLSRRPDASSRVATNCPALQMETASPLMGTMGPNPFLLSRFNLSATAPSHISSSWRPCKWDYPDPPTMQMHAEKTKPAFPT
jgi:hypothetical protein